LEFGAVHPTVRYSTVDKKAATPFLLKKKKNAKVVAFTPKFGRKKSQGLKSS